MSVKIKLMHPDAVLPAYAKPGDAGMDLVAVDDGLWSDSNYIEYRTGISLSIPLGFVGLVFPRSSISTRNLILTNSVGIIDAGFRGEITARFAANATHVASGNWSTSYHPYVKGDKIAQLMILPYPIVEWRQVQELDKTERGEGGYGSTGL